MLAPLLLILANAAHAQVLINPETKEGALVAEFFRKAWERKPATSLKCHIWNQPPWMGFDFRMWTGYNVLLPAKQFNGSANEIATLMNVRLKRDPSKVKLFYSGRLPIPAVDKGGREFYYEGGVLVGPGEYLIELLVTDREDRTCRKEWSVKANAGKVESGLPPDTVAAFAPNRWRGFSKDELRSGRVTILLHAAPMRRRRYATKLSTMDRSVLLNSLTSVLNRSSFAAARVVVFDLDGRRVLFEAEDFTPQDYRRLARELANVQLGTIDINVLNKARPDKLLVDLLLKEQNAKQQADRILFLGPAHRFAGKMLDEVRDVQLELPPTYYLAFSFLNLSPDDWINRVVKKLAKGKTLPYWTPADLSGAIEKTQAKP